MSKSKSRVLNKKFPKLTIINIDSKIREVERRIKCFEKWHAPIKFVNLKFRCMNAAREQLAFLKDHKKQKRDEWKSFVGSISSIDLESLE